MSTLPSRRRRGGRRRRTLAPVDAAAQDAAAHKQGSALTWRRRVAGQWWETLQGSLRAYASMTRRLVATALRLDVALAGRFRGECRVVFAARSGRLNRDWLDLPHMLDVAGSVEGVRALSARLSLTSAGDDGQDWGSEWDGDGWPGAAAGPAAPRARLTTLVARLQNCSVLVGVTGEALASGLWMRPGSLVVQVLPYGAKGRYGREVPHARPARLSTCLGTCDLWCAGRGAGGRRPTACPLLLLALPGVDADASVAQAWQCSALNDSWANAWGRQYAVLAHANPRNYIEVELPGSAASFYPWNPHPTATADSHLYWLAPRLRPRSILCLPPRFSVSDSCVFVRTTRSRQQDPGGAALLYMQAGGLQMPDADIVSLMKR